MLVTAVSLRTHQALGSSSNAENILAFYSSSCWPYAGALAHGHGWRRLSRQAPYVDESIGDAHIAINSDNNCTVHEHHTCKQRFLGQLTQHIDCIQINCLGTRSSYLQLQPLCCFSSLCHATIHGYSSLNSCCNKYRPAHANHMEPG
jgi:hypothetical protein